MSNSETRPITKENSGVDKIDRRTLLLRAGTIAAVGAAVFPARHAEAQSENDASWQANAALIEAALDCEKQSEVCLAHCISTFKQDSTMLAECAGLVVETAAICSALVTLASGGSERLDAMARITIASCTACEKECRRHASHHDECKTCADSCITCIQECERLLA